MPDPIVMSRPSGLLGIATMAGLLFASQAHAADTRLGIDADFSHIENVNRAAREPEEQSDNAVSVEAYAARSFMLSSRSGVVVRGGLRVREFLDFGDLSSLGVTGRVAYRFQPTPGFTSPWLELAAGIDAFKHRDSEIRDGHILSLSASVGKHFTDRIRLEAGVGLDERDAYEGDVYALSNLKAWAGMDYKLGPSATLYGSATWMDGEQVFTLLNPAAWSSLYANASASAADPVFASAFGGAAPTAYRVDATAVLLELGLNFALTGSQALDLSASWFDSEAEGGGGSYDGATFRVGYLYRFR